MKQQKQISHYYYNEEDCLFHQYEVKVYKGKDANNGEDVRIKIIDMVQGKQQSVDNEITYLKQLQSEGIVKLIDVLANSKSTVIITEFGDGKDLRQDLTLTGGQYFEWHALAILRQLMVGFKELAKNGIIHRNIKPESFQLCKGVFKLTNFDLATSKDNNGSLPRHNVINPIYYAPQLLADIPYTNKCDIWSIGIMACEMVYGRDPWFYGGSNEEYLIKLTTKPLKFPLVTFETISDQYNDFIAKCLIVDEHDRIGWEELFKHPVLTATDNSNNLSTHQIDERNRVNLYNLKKIIKQQGKEANKAFLFYDLNKNGKIDQIEFYKFIRLLDASITTIECYQLFKFLDLNQDGQLQIEEFSQMFDNSDSTIPEGVVEQYIQRLQEFMKRYQVNLELIYNNYDDDWEGDLNLNQFTKIIKEIVPDFESREIEQIFKKFDKNNDQRISFTEFLKGMQFGAKEQFNPYNERAQKVLQELKRIVKQKNMTVEQLLMIFDSNQNNKLELPEFTQLCKLLDPTSNDEEQKLVFKLIDTNNDGYLDQDELAKLLV